MRNPTDPADRTGTIGVEAFDAAYGPDSRRPTTRRTLSSASSSRTAGRSWRTGRPEGTAPAVFAFVNGTMRTEARLTRTGADGDVSMGLAGSWAAGEDADPVRMTQVEVRPYPGAGWSSSHNWPGSILRDAFEQTRQPPRGHRPSLSSDERSTSSKSAIHIPQNP